MMASETERMFDSKTLAISALCLLGAAYSSFLLIEELNNRGHRSGTPMARIERFEAGVRLKPAKSFIWSGIENNEQLYRRDSIQTPPGTGATIRFNDNTQLELGENSLVVIDDVKDLALNTVRGSLVIRTAEGDSKITVDTKTGKAKVEQLSIRMLRPEPLATFYGPEGQGARVSFSFEPVAKAGVVVPDELKVQVSPDRTFRSAKTIELPFPKGTKDSATGIAPGRWYWRVAAKDKPLTDAVQFRVESVVALRPIYPNAVKVPVWDEKTPLQFRWDPGNGASLAKVEHVLDVASDPTFTKVAVSQKIVSSTGIASLEGLPVGRLYWRIRSQIQEIAVASRTESFDIEKTAKIPVELVRPGDRSSSEFTPEVRFHWSAEAPNVDYRWEIFPAAAVAGAAPLASETVKGLSHSWKSAAEGAFKWHVQAVYNGQVIGESPFSVFSLYKGAALTLRTPAKDQEFYFWSDPPKLTFSWSNDKLASETGFAYQLDISKDADFKSVVKTQKLKTTELAGNSLGLNGEYFWRVRVVDDSGQSVKSSDTFRFAYGVHPPLRAPASVAGDAPMTWNPLEVEKPPTLKWTPVDDARSYEVVVKSEGQPQEKIVLRQVTKDTSIDLPKNMGEGKYSWTTTAIDQLNRRGTPMPGHPIEVTYGAVLGAPEATSPEVQ